MLSKSPSGLNGFLPALTAVLLLLLLVGCSSSGTAVPAGSEGGDPQAAEDVLQRRTLEVADTSAAQASQDSVTEAEEVRLSSRFVEEAFADYAQRTNTKLTLFFQAQQRYHAGQYVEALRLINRALEWGESADALAMKGLIFAGLQAEEQAISYWQRAIALDPDVFERILLPRE
ncbi:hypothetical protein CYPRO_1127 [Cyclonatronum proteinivorum]|uniref:Tetratricopeptide repeat-containing protein n=1 Tax=Cyclonatronum proteinivorum TaxID=1457365 RepID=A0A345UIU0_9BACT|nr:tetratricopeptide repeat protein [Cyclonatronum proteinivorum]AXJ00392.1 hypothetical protein CYPRO_1127 [Cyclonatronum proteinivorum]